MTRSLTPYVKTVINDALGIIYTWNEDCETDTITFTFENVHYHINICLDVVVQQHFKFEKFMTTTYGNNYVIRKRIETVTSFESLANKIVTFKFDGNPKIDKYVVKYEIRQRNPLSKLISIGRGNNKCKKHSKNPIETYMSSSVSSQVCRNLIIEMKNKGISQCCLAKKMGVSKQYVNQMLNGKVPLTSKAFENMRQALQHINCEK